MGAVRLLRRAYVGSGARALLPSRLKNSGRGVWTRLARGLGYPVSSPQVPRPPLARSRVRMRLSHALLACDLNPRYLESWPLVSRAWEELVGVEPLLVLVADEEHAPPELVGDPRVRLFPPLPHVHTALQAQCIRLLFPALVEAPGAVVTSDMELVPLRSGYFHDPVRGIDERFFVAYRGDAFLHREQIPIAYNAARPETWGDVFGIRDLEDARACLARWGARGYDGTRGGAGWYTDQHVLFRSLTHWPEGRARVWLLDDQSTRHRRLERAHVEAADELPSHVRRGLREGRYTDFDACIPHRSFAELNELVYDLARESVRRGSRLLSRSV